MYACVLSGQYDIAVFLYYSLLKDTTILGTEWQRGGQYDGIHPLCKELFIRAAGKFSTGMEHERYSDDSVAIFNDIVANGGNLSPTSLYGLFLSLQRSGKYLISLDILRKIMNHTCDDSSWNIVDEHAENFLVLHRNATLPLKPISGKDVVDGKIVTSVMLSCVQYSEFGLALLIGRMISSTKSNQVNEFIDFAPIDEAAYRTDHHVASLLASDIHRWENEEYGQIVLECFKDLKCLGVVEILQSQDVNEASSPTVESEEANTASSNISWLEAYSHLHHLSQTLNSLLVGSFQLNKLQSYHLIQKLATMMKCCTDAGQPRVGIYMTELFAQHMNLTSEAQPRILSLISESIFGKSDAPKPITSHDMHNSMLAFVSSSDSLFCAIVRAYEKSGGIDSALTFYFSSLQAASTGLSASAVNQVFQINTANYVLSLLVQRSRLDDAISLYNLIPEAARNRDTYTMMAQAYANSCKWNEVSSLYNYALEKGFLTEALGLLAMKGVERSVMDGKVRLIRSIASDMAAMTGEQSDKWIASRYWTLKKYVGFHYARLLMWWRDPHSTQRNELALAIQYLKDHKLRGSSINDEALRVIIKFIAKRYNETHEERDRLYAVETILESLKVADNTMLAMDSAFISDAALSLQLLNEFDVSYDIVTRAVERGVEVDTNVVANVMDKHHSIHLNNQKNAS